MILPRKLSPSTDMTTHVAGYSPSLLEVTIVVLIGRRQHDAAVSATVLTWVQLAIPDDHDVIDAQVRCSEVKHTWVDGSGPQ